MSLNSSFSEDCPVVVMLIGTESLFTKERSPLFSDELLIYSNAYTSRTTVHRLHTHLSQERHKGSQCQPTSIRQPLGFSCCRRMV